jgi:uncharacterized protein (TIGR03435 family)
MIPNSLPQIWTTFALAMGNHLWQSTLFALTAGLLTLLLRKNHARARYWLWLAASAKFLIPFALLIGLGSHLAWSHGPAVTNTGLYFAVEEIGQPFAQPTIQAIPLAAPMTALSTLIHLLPLLLTAVWLCGFIVVLCVWCFRWLRISKLARESLPLRHGRELETLRRLEHVAGMQRPIEMRFSRTSLEPGIFGIVRPVLVWPEGISDRLEDAHLEAVLAHELWHVRRRDNLAAALHMLVEAIFWFYPLVWWMGARLVEERERACDEEVLESGSDRKVYAESILKICEFRVGSPLACVSGVTGADLRKRIVHIMTEDIVRGLDFSRKLLLSAAGLLAVAVPIAFGLLHATQTRAQSQTQNPTAIAPVFQAASIKPNTSDHGVFRMMFTPDGFSATSVTLQMLIRTAYDVQEEQISGAPGWFASENYDLEAKMDSSVANELSKLSEAQRNIERRRMLQGLLADRFKLTFHRETKELGVYSLVITKDGSRLQQAKPGDTYPNGFKGPDGGSGAGMFRMGTYAGGAGELAGQRLPIASQERASLVGLLTEQLGRPVLDKTGLVGDYDFTLKWGPKENGDSIFNAVQEQLGLKLESQEGPVEVFVIDHAEQPTGIRPANIAAALPVFGAASIKPHKPADDSVFTVRFTPDGFTATDYLQELIQITYKVHDFQLDGVPKWLYSEKWDINAKTDKSVANELQKLNHDDLMAARDRMLQALFADRFKLRLHRETRELPVYGLVIAKNGPKFQEAKPSEYPGKSATGDGLLEGQATSMERLAWMLSDQTGRIVVDKTGLAGNYDYKLQWKGGTPHLTLSQLETYPVPPRESSASPIFTAIQDQLGLKLEPQTGPVEVLVIDHVEQPAEN